MKNLIVGVLALQGDFAKHIEILRSLGVIAKEVRKAEDLKDCQGLIIPGGESTVMLRQINFIEMKETLKEFARHKPVFGTCAGLILMSKEVQNSSMNTLGLLNITVERNAFGRQIESFHAPVELYFDSNHSKFFRAYFIRAPKIRRWGPEVQVLASFEGEPILVQQGHYLGSSFHPELTSDPLVHEYFLQMIKGLSDQSSILNSL